MRDLIVRFICWLKGHDVTPASPVKAPTCRRCGAIYLLVLDGVGGWHPRRR
jgi:hypothetical protein